MATHIWWIRRDLRLHDNQALAAALSGATALVPLFVLDPRLTESTVRSPRRLSFLFACLRALDGELRRRGSRLIVRVGDPVTVVSEVAREAGARLVVAEADATPYARQRDAAVSTRVPLTLKPGLTIHPPGTVHRPDGRPYTVFTQFARAWHARGVPDRRELLSAPPVLPPPPALATVPLPEPTETIPDRFPIGEAAARRQLQRFLEERLLTYDTGRNLLDGSGSSQLSPYFRFGLLSVREAWVRAAAVAQEPSGTRGVQAWLNELVWREFYHHLLAAFPTSVRCSLRPAFDRAPWVRDEALFRRWRDGETGFPVVDAAMRQLATEGWISNRARMVVANALTKVFLMDWRLGERHFRRTLLDGDLAANVGGWQWSAGTGTDAAPFFRIFNPVRQGERFDPTGDWIRRWVPELCNVPNEFLYAPWRMPLTVQQAAGCRIGHDYPSPVVDYEAARRRALAWFDGLRAPQSE